LKDVSVTTEPFNPMDIRSCGERALERENLSLLSEIVQSVKHHAAGFKRNAPRVETGQPQRDRISVNVFQDSQFIAKEKWRQCGFPARWGRR